MEDVNERYEKLFLEWKRARLAIEYTIPFEYRKVYYGKMTDVECELREERRELGESDR